MISCCTTQRWYLFFTAENSGLGLLRSKWW